MFYIRGGGFPDGALIAWSFKRKYLWQELLVIVYTEGCIFPNNCILHRVSPLHAGLPPAC